MTFLDKIFDARDGKISDSSRKLYARNLKALHGEGEINSLDFLDNVENICKSISHLSDNTKKSYIIAICTVLKGSKKQDLYETYFDIMKDFNSKLSINTSKSRKQSENWIDQSGVDSLRETLAKDVPKKITIQADYE